MRNLESNTVSVITPAFNSEKIIGETIESVIAQTYLQWEMIIVIDSGTTDSTASVVLSYANKDPRIKLIEIKDGKGISLSRNLALRQAKGQYIAFLDSDDLWLPQKLELQIQFMIKNAFSISCTGYRRINADNTIIGRLVLPPEKQRYSDILKNNLIACPTVLIDQSKTGLLVMPEFSHEDYILWLKILKKGFVCGGLAKDLAKYRIMPNSRSQNVNRSGSRWQVYRQFEGLSFFVAIYYFLFYALTSIGKRLRF